LIKFIDSFQLFILQKHSEASISGNHKLEARIRMTSQFDTTDRPRKVPSHEVAYTQLRDMILFGQLTPGQSVTIQGLTDLLGTGMTPVREAIRKLIAEGALDFQGNRRVCVPYLTAEQLDELAFARQTIEPRLVEMAAPNLAEQHIANLVAIDAAINAAIQSGDVSQYLKHNHLFHFTLYKLANAPILLAMTHSLWLRFGPSLRVVCGRFGTSSLPDRHEQALTAMQCGDAKKMSDAMRQDILQGIELVRQSLGRP
jgi:DNA-binding GntR family transcriptional regulator